MDLMETDKKDYRRYVVIAVLVVVALGMFAYFNSGKDQTQELNNVDEALSEQDRELNSLSNEEAKKAIDDILHSLLIIHIATLQEIESNNPDTFIYTEIQETLNDRSKLSSALDSISEAEKSKSLLVSTTALVIKVNVAGLIEAHDIWVQYLRAVDVDNVDLSEFQYQMALFQTSTKEHYLDIVENAHMLPALAIDFSGDEEALNGTNEEIRDYLLQRIDDLFADYLIENEKFYAETQNRYAIMVLIEGYLDFLTGGVE